jgi:capsular polysaccharide biosynthesis protein
VSPDRDPRVAAARPELEAEEEVDFGRYWWAIVARWWLVVAAIGAGIVIGYLVSLGGGDVFEARATVYLGQPLTPSGSSQIQSIQTNPSTVNQIVRSRSVVVSVASDVGVPPGELRQGVSTKAVSGAVARLGQTPLVEISVRGPWRRQSAEAANRLAEIVVDRVSGYANVKIDQFGALLETQTEQLDALEGTIARFRSAAEAGTGLSSAERLVLIGLLDNAERERTQLLADRTATELSLSLAQEVERGQVVTRASASEVAARSRRTSMLVGAVVGLVVGVALALGWESLARRRLARSEV